MNPLFNVILSATSVTSEATSQSGGTGGGSTEKLKETLLQIVKSPIFYIVIGVIILLIVGFYLYRRLIKPRPGVVKVIVRGGKIVKLLDEKSPNYFLTPFKESLGAEISLSEKEFSSDKLFINNGPDALYKMNYTLSYKIEDIEKFFPVRDSFQNAFITKINDGLREYADNGHALELVQGYREHHQEILSIINEIGEQYGVSATKFKVNYIEPFGNK